MDLASIKSFLKPGKPASADFIRFMRMLLQGLATQVIEGDSDELAEFRKETGPLADRLDENSSSEDILLAVTVGLRSLEDYNRRTQKFILAHTVELKTALRTMTETVAVLMQSRTESGEQLTAVERKMEQASAIEDIRELRRKLQDCLVLIKEENTRLKIESKEKIESLQRQVEVALKAADSPSRVGEGVDAVTGLEGHAAAEQLIAKRISDRKPCVIALFVINRLATINRRFGRKVGDEVLVQVAQHLGQLLPGNSVLFRWSGPALAALVEIQPNFDDVNRKLLRIASGQLEKNIEDGERSVFVPIMTLLHVQKVTIVTVAKEVIRQMDHFVAENSGDRQAVS
jgi:GGDEF domain-containing protein